MKGPLLQLTAGQYAIKLSVLKLRLRDDLEQTLGLMMIDAFLFLSI